MADISHQFWINSPPEDVFAAITSPEGLDAWWTLRAGGRPVVSSEYELYFGPESDWRAVVSQVVENEQFELTITAADGDWLGSKVSFRIWPENHGTGVDFLHAGWPEANDHYRISSFCWAMYLRLLKRFVECGETVDYQDRLSV